MVFCRKNKFKLNKENDVKEENFEVINFKYDNLLQDIIKNIMCCDTISTTYLQRNFKIGYRKAREYMDLLLNYGIIQERELVNGYEVIIKDMELIKRSIEENNQSEVCCSEESSGIDFEKDAAEILKANGFERVNVTNASRDYGVDIIAYKDEIKYAIQCKKYSSPVGIKAVQEVLGSKTMYECHVGVVLTNNTFTSSAKKLAAKNNILLWDGKKLKELIKNKNI